MNKNKFISILIFIFFFTFNVSIFSKTPSKLDGKKLYHETKYCYTCHGIEGKKPVDAPKDIVYPIISGQNKEYLIQQLKLFRSGYRNSGDSSLMTAYARILSDEEIEVIADYLSKVK